MVEHVQQLTWPQNWMPHCGLPSCGQDSSSKTGVPIAPGALRESGLCALGAMPWSSGGCGFLTERIWEKTGWAWEKLGFL